MTTVQHLLTLVTVTFGVALASSPDPVLALERDASRERQLARVQMHRNGLRGLAYVSRWEPDGSSEPATITFERRGSFALPGDPEQNLSSNLAPVDGDGDGEFELVQFLGSRFIRAFSQDGKRLWSVENPSGRLHRLPYNRDTVAVLDVDGDGGQEIVHCWVEPGSNVKRLVARRGSDGKVVRSAALTGDPASSECQVAAFHVEDRERPLILVGRQVPAAGAACPRLWVDTWAVTAAFDTELRPQWQRSTCDAGHYAWPLDEDEDGRAEAIFVGKHLLEPDGKLECTLPGWGDDHLDSLLVADLDPDESGHEAVAVGYSGTRTYRAKDCRPQGAISSARIPNAQSVNAAALNPETGAPTVFVRQRTFTDRRTAPRMLYRLDQNRTEIRWGFFESTNKSQVPMQNGNLDGAQAVEDLVTGFGQVIDQNGRVRLSTAWYWDLQGPAERNLDPWDQWTNAPLVIDLDGDGTDEIVTWGRRMVAIGGLPREEED